MSGEAYSRYVDLCVKIYKSNSPYKDTFFEGWSQEEINDILSYSDEVSELRDDNDNIIVEFRKLDSEEAGFNQKAADFYKQLVLNNNKIARHFKDKNGDTYANYYDYAYDNVYVRDYGETELTQMRQYVGQYIVPLFGDVLSKYQQTSAKLTFEDKRLISAFEDKKYSANDIVEGYWNSYIDSFTGSMKEGLNLMFENNNCAFVSKGDCYQGAYTTTIYDTNQPFCYFGKGYQNIATVAHEVGHYYAGLYEEGSLMYDLAETHSQGNEWMLMSYLEDAMAADGYSEAYKALYYWQMVNQLYVIIVGTIIDHYESKVYALSDDVLENFTSASFDSLMTDVCTAYGGITTINTVTDIQAYWRSVCLESPVYYISYATSALASLSLYTAIETDMAAGREIYRKIVEEVDYTTGFLGNLEAVGLASPFEQSAYTNLRTLINSK
jgi:oligoendopeptidase F